MTYASFVLITHNLDIPLCGSVCHSDFTLRLWEVARHLASPFCGKGGGGGWGPSILLTCAKDSVAVGTWKWGGAVTPPITGGQVWNTSMYFRNAQSKSATPGSESQMEVWGHSWMRMKIKAGSGNVCQMGAAEYEWPWNTDSGGTECMVHARSHSHRTRESHKSVHSSVTHCWGHQEGRLPHGQWIPVVGSKCYQMTASVCGWWRLVTWWINTPKGFIWRLKGCYIRWG